MGCKLGFLLTVAVVAAVGLASARADVLDMPTGQTSLDLVWVGDTNNPADPTTGYGAVGYAYQMGKYEVSNAQYAQFLNAKASASDPYAYNTSMGDTTYGGITRSASAPYTYTAKSGYENRPVMYVCWYDTIRFANWLQNGQDGGGTEAGTYTITGGGPNSGNVTIPDAAERATWTPATKHWVLPSENEWYKSGYYQPAAKGGDGDGYWLYPTGTNAVPTAEAPPGGSNSANFNNAVPSPYLTNVRAYTGSDSYSGTLDQGGNVWEWNEADIGGSSRGLRGGSVDSYEDYLRASFRFNYNPTSEDYSIGFRVANVPEPSGIAMLVAGAIAALMYWKGRR